MLYLNYMALLLGLQGVKVISIEYNEIESIAEILVMPENHKQHCPYCLSKDTIRFGMAGKGEGRFRRIKHIKIASSQCVLVVPRKRNYSVVAEGTREKGLFNKASFIA